MKNENNTLKRYAIKKIAKDLSEETICFISLIRTKENSYNISVNNLENNNPEEVNKIFDHIKQQNNNSGNSSKNETAYITSFEQFILDFEKKGYSVKEIPSGDLEMTIQMDLESGMIISNASQMHEFANSSLIEDIGHNIHKAIKNLVNTPSQEITNEIKNKISKNEHSEAYKYLKTCNLLFIKPDEDLINTILEIDYKKLSDEDVLGLYKINISLASKIKRFALVEKKVKQISKELRDKLEPDFYLNLLLIRANAAAQNGKNELALELYEEIVNFKEVLSGTKAWAYRGMSLIFTDKEKIQKAHENCFESFLQAGNKIQAITELHSLAEQNQYINPEKALIYLDEAISLLEAPKNGKDIYRGRLLHKKAQILLYIGNFFEAKNIIEESIELQRGQMGIEQELITSLNLSLLISNKLELKDQNLYLEEISKIEKYINSKEYELKKKISAYLAGNSLLNLIDLEKEVNESGFNTIIALFNIVKVISDKNLEHFEKLELLDKSNITFKAEKASKEDFMLLYQTFAQVYLMNGNELKALEWLKKFLSSNPFNDEARNNVVIILIKNCLWEEAVEFFKGQIETFGELPRILYFLGKSLNELNLQKEAFQYLSKAIQLKPDDEEIKNEFHKVLPYIQDSDLNKSTKKYKESKSISLEEFKKCLDKFGKMIAKDKRMQFWKSEDKVYNWNSSPENLASNFFHIFLKGYFDEDVKIVSEVISGAGRIDLIIALNGGVTIIVELKICGGAGYSTNYAIEGVEQLLHYLKHQDTKIGFLIIFDGRMDLFGTGLEETINENGCTIFVRFIDVRPKYKADKKENTKVLKTKKEK